MTKQVAQVNLWRESWAACKECFRAFLPSILGIGMLLIICNFYYMPDEIQKVMEQIDAVMAGNELPNHVMPRVALLAHACAALIHLAGVYYFSVLYLRRSPIGVKPEMGTDSFFKWIGQIALAALCILGVGFGAILIVGLLGAVGVYFLHMDEKLLAMITSVVGACAFAVAAGRFITVSPVALMPVNSAFRMAWQMSKGNWWRLIWHYLMLVSVVWMWLILILLIPALIILIMVPMAMDSPIFIGILSFVFGISGAAVLASGSIYCCVACRVLMQEQALPSRSESV